MKILQINSVCGYGSTGKIAVDIAKSAENHKHECIIAYGRRDANNYPNAIKIGTNNDVRVHGILSRLTDKHGLFSKKMTTQFIEKVKEMNPDVIHLHNIHGYYIHYPILFEYLKESKKPVVWTLHDCWSFTGHCAYYTYAQCNKYLAGCGKCPQLKEYPKAFTDSSHFNLEMKRKVFAGLKNLTIVTPSSWLKHEVEKTFLSDYPVRVIHNGIDLEKFKTVNFKRKSDKKIILGVASVWERRKGLETFIKLSEILPEAYEIVLVGLTSSQIKTLPNNIRGIEKTDSVEELVEYYNEAVVFLNPTLEDNYPTTNLEAQACGTPVVTFDVGGAKETLKASCTIAVSPEIQIDELCSTVIEYAQKKVDINSEEIDYRVLAEKYIELYEEIAHG